MTTLIYADFETASIVDLKTRGLDVYANDASTHVLCFAYAIDDGEVKLWTPADENPTEIFDLLANGAKLVAHNANFETSIWNSVCVNLYNWPEIKTEQTICTMVMSYAMALPGRLEGAAAALGLDFQKDMRGHRMMMKLSSPKTLNKLTGEAEWHKEIMDHAVLHEYCKQDVRAERELFKRAMKLSDSEYNLWCLDQKINKRGIAVDTKAVKNAIAVVEAEQKRLDAKIRELSDNAIATCGSVTQIKNWIESFGTKVEGVAKEDVIELLADETLPEVVREVLKTRQEASKSSVKKLQAIQNRMSADGRIRGSLQFNGAQATRRWAARGVQLHNLPRPSIKQDKIEEILAIFGSDLTTLEISETITKKYGSPNFAIANSLRGFLTAKNGCDLVAADFSNIEGRILAWLAGEEWKLEAFSAFDRGTGPDLYILGYSKSFHVPVNEVTDLQRQIGKVQELSLGFGGGKAACARMAKGFGIEIEPEKAEEIKIKWREAHTETVAFWFDLERAAIQACLDSKNIYTAGHPKRRVSYRKAGSFLWCKLPSGGVICYPYPEIRRVVTPWGAEKDALTYMAEDSQSKKWQRETAYGGLLCENVTQATARDVLASGIQNVTAGGYDVVLHVHDEVISEVKKDFGSVNEYTALMEKLPQWAEGLPIKAAGWRGSRYRK